MFLGMPWFFYLAIAIAAAFIYLTRLKEQPTPPEPVEATFYDGPLHGSVDKMPEYLDFLITPYIPEDENDREVLGRDMYGREVYKHNFAYYTHIADGNYFFKRDLTMEEVENIQNGKPPV